MKRMSLYVAVVFLSTTFSTYAQRLHDRAWGLYFAAYGCDLKGPAAAEGCRSVHVWQIRYGYFGSTIIAGKTVALSVASDSPAAKGQWRGTLYIDSTAFDNQVAAITGLYRRELAPYFAPDGLKVEVQPVTFSVNQGVYSIRIGPPGKKEIAAADIAPNAFAWWSTPRAQVTPLMPTVLDALSAVRTGEAPQAAKTDLHLGQAYITWHPGEATKGSAVLCKFEVRGQAYLDRGKSR